MRRIVLVLLPALVAFVCAAVALDVLRIPRASLGFGIAGLRIVGVAPGSQAEQAGMQRDDSLAPSTPMSLRLRAMWYDAYRPGQTETFAFGHDAHYTNVTLTAVEHPPPFAYRNEVLIVLRTCIYLALLFIGAWLVLLRPARFTWGFYACIIGLAPFPVFVGWSFTALHPILGLVAYCVWLVAADVANVGFLIFALRFPTDEANGWRARVWRSLPLWLLAFVALDAWAVIAWYNGLVLPAPVLWGPAVLAFGAWATGTAALFATYGHADSANRRRLQWAIAGSSLGYFAWFAERALTDLHAFSAALIAGFAISVLPLSVAYAVVRHRMFDLRFMVNRALTFSVLGSLLVALFALSWWFGAVVLARSPLDLPLQVVLALAVGASLHRVIRWLERTLERAIFRRLQTAEQTLTRVRAGFGEAPSYAVLETLLTQKPLEALDLEYAALYRHGENAEYIRTAHAGKSAALPAQWEASADTIASLAVTGEPVRWGESAVAIPIGGTPGRPEALAVYGPHCNGFDLAPDEVALLATFATAAAPSYAKLAAQTVRARSVARLLRPPEAVVDASFASDVAEHVLRELPEEDRLVLAACVTLPHATADDVAFLAGTPTARARLLELAATTALVTKAADDTFVVHPLLHEPLRRQVAHRTHSDVLRCAAWRMSERDFRRAAHLYAAVGDRVRALGAWSAASRNGTPPAELARAVASLVAVAPADELAACADVVLAYIREAWLLSNEPDLRERVAEARELLGAADPLRAALAGWLAYSYCRAGLSDKARAVLADADEPAVHLVEAMLAAQRGAFAESSRRLDAFDAIVSVAGSALPPSALVRSALCSARCEWDAARALLDGVLAGVPRETVRLLTQAELVILEWLTGHGEAVIDAGDQYPRSAAFAGLMRASLAAEPSERAALCDSVLRTATPARETFAACLAEVALAQTIPSERFDHAARAAALAETLDAPLLVDAVERAVDDEPAGALAPFVHRLRAVQPPTGVFVDIAQGAIRSGAQAIAVSERELGVLIALASAPVAHANASLIDMLWPEMDDTAGAKALQTCVYRARLRLGEASAIESVAQGYRLGPNVTVDLWDAEHVVRALERHALTPADRIRLEGIVRRLDGPRFPASLAWEWYDALERRVRTVLRDARERLAGYYLQGGVPARALTHARAMIAADDIDERGYELAIRAHLAANAATEGWRELRQYRRALARTRTADTTNALAALLTHSTGERFAREG